MTKKIHFIDVGARDNLHDPWASHEKDLKVVGFEPDRKEFLRLQKEYPEREYFNIGLSSKEGKVNLYETGNPYQSSIYPPNRNNLQFEGQHWELRQTKLKVEIECSTIDKVLKGYNVDAIKIDTQGAEYDILKGGMNTLVSQKPILFLETWCHPVYSDAPLMHEILQLVYSIGYELWAVEPAASWHYKIDEGNHNVQGHHRRLIGLNLMLVQSLEQLKKLEPERIRARIKVLRWYKFFDAAYLLAKHMGDKDLELDIKKQMSQEVSLLNRIIKRFKKNHLRPPPIT
tara:strand:+ start:21914 stop:22771 length:858 start_codon:yes stop_codon:yes gene_type:complete